MRVGGMHLTMAYIASIGTFFADGGLLALLTDSDVYAHDTARQLLIGKQYARGLRALRLVHEVLFRLFFQAMNCWLQRQERVRVRVRVCPVQDVQKVEQLKKALSSDLSSINSVMKDISDFKKVGCEQSETFKYWATFLEGGDLLLQLLRAEREGNFELHLDTVCGVLPWLKAAGRHTYSKFLPVYVADMKALEHQHPASHQHMCSGGFVVRRSPDHRFNAVATDQALEQTVNRDGKSKGGVIGLTLRKSALTRWLMTRHVSAEYLDGLREMCKTTGRTETSHKECGKSRMARDEKDVRQIMEIAENCQNPFDLDSVPPQLINIITGQVASEAVEKSLDTFLQYGTRRHKEFVQQRLVEKTKSFWHAESRSKTLTFSDMQHGVKTKASDKMLVDFEVIFLATAGSFQAKRGQLRIMNWPIYHHHCFMIMAV